MLAKIKIICALGVLNICHIILYRVKLKLKFYTKILPIRPIELNHFYKKTKPILQFNVEGKINYFQCFSKHIIKLNKTLDWFTNPYTGYTFSSEKHWSIIKDFESREDIKTIWELSRFPFLIPLAATGKIDKINELLKDWCHNNPWNQGPNWKCGQEASLRIMTLLMTAKLLGQLDSLSKDFQELISLHVKRIIPTMEYAIAQDNNHGTSEAAAVYCAGLALKKYNPQSKKWIKTGKRALEKRIKRLIQNDGTFSQYSQNYHRLMLDTISFAELMRNEFKDTEFSTNFYEKATLASEWLYEMVNEGGEVPNGGANDGALLFPWPGYDYRDFRSSVKIAYGLFKKLNCYGKYADELLDLYNLTKKNEALPSGECRLFDKGGYVILRKNNTTAFIKFPNYKFRPSHADALHLDLWRGSKYLLKDSGTYSYNPSEKEFKNYFSATQAHNTIEFDNRSQMPKIGCFLWGSWLKTKDYHFSAKDSLFSSSYTDYCGCYHHRQVKIDESSVKVEDTIAGFSEVAIMRWHLHPGKWKISGTKVISEFMTLKFEIDDNFENITLVDGYESCYYLYKTNLPVIELILKGPCKIKTYITIL